MEMQRIYVGKGRDFMRMLMERNSSSEVLQVPATHVSCDSTARSAS